MDGGGRRPEDSHGRSSIPLLSLIFPYLIIFSRLPSYHMVYLNHSKLLKNKSLCVLFYLRCDDAITYNRSYWNSHFVAGNTPRHSFLWLVGQ